jgi:TrmH family RNA methyltransferase
MTEGMRHIRSRDNPLLQRVRRLAQDPVAYRKLGVCWLEGEHLTLAFQQRGLRAGTALIAESAVSHASYPVIQACTDQQVVVSDPCFAEFSPLPAQAAWGLLFEMPSTLDVDPHLPTVVLDRVQDAGNVGSILRSAAALGVPQVIALRGTAGLWSPKVLRAGMGAHFALRLLESKGADCLDRLVVPLVATSSHAEATLTEGSWQEPCAWVVGNEGQGIAAEVMARCRSTVRIPQPGGEESLNVAAAAAICLYESMRRRRIALAQSQ